MSTTYDGSLDQRTGHDLNFLGPRIELPTANEADDAVLVNGTPVVHYTRFSLGLSKSRKLCRWVTWGIDGSSLPDPNGLNGIGRDDLEFVLDPRIDADLQTGNGVYKRNRLDRGHIARRADLLWGERDVAVVANKDSFFLTNITPQMDNFNQSALHGVWGRLENALLDHVDDDNSRVTVMAGPVLADTDLPYRTVRVPVEFWKLFVYQRNSEVRTRGFIVTQSLDGLKRRDPFAEFIVVEKTVEEIAEKANLTFDNLLHKVENRGRTKTRGRGASSIIEREAQIEW
ncbi:MAG: DNA/RNA non-specific endonuclease [Pseudonocardia sp.]|nr:MAG: DNA/RNA non-specific endonuclease [Pseudonocardia sp.]